MSLVLKKTMNVVMTLKTKLAKITGLLENSEMKLNKLRISYEDLIQINISKFSTFRIYRLVFIYRLNLIIIYED